MFTDQDRSLEKMIDFLIYVKEGKHKLDLYDEIRKENIDLKNEIRGKKRIITFLTKYVEDLEDGFGVETCPECNGAGGYTEGECNQVMCHICGGLGCISLKAYNERKESEKK